MGSLVYESLVFEFDDRLLAHLQVVIVNKLRRGEPFIMSWKVASERGSGRGSIWLDPSTPLYFEFDGSRSPSINREWLARLANAADSTRGLVVEGEDGGNPVVGRPVPIGVHRAFHAN
ncbi:ATP-dependent DNA ligase [Microbacterium sp. X-17]|uniref:DUF7882 family protein n=1 Tax=Microbacterium sp. X-17 TaxID=3144404 RepID=UPI0031F539CD